MRWTLMTVAALALAGCGGGKDGNSPTTGGTVVPPGVAAGGCTASDTGCGGPVGPQFMEPLAVGFEVLATIHDDGTLHPLRYEDGSETPPLLLLTFADAEFFAATNEIGQQGHFCEVALPIDTVVPNDSSDLPLFATHNGSGLNWFTELSLDFSYYYTFAGTECGSVLDTGRWGVDGGGLLYEFQGARVGIGFGPMTDYLWDSWGGRDATGNEDYTDKFMAQYIALGDRNENWGGCDWTSMLLYEVDPATDIAVEDPANPGYLKLPLVTENLGNGTVPHSMIRSFAYWYQDFDLISKTNAYPWDFMHLPTASGNGAPLCDQ